MSIPKRVKIFLSFFGFNTIMIKAKAFRVELEIEPLCDFLGVETICQEASQWLTKKKHLCDTRMVVTLAKEIFLGASVCISWLNGVTLHVELPSKVSQEDIEDFRLQMPSGFPCIVKLWHDEFDVTEIGVTS